MTVSTAAGPGTASALRVEFREGVAHVVIDQPGRAVNVIGRALVSELSAVLESLARDGAVVAVVIRSGKPSGFLAGADLDELAAIAASPGAADDGLAASRAGQALMNAVEDFPKPVVAAVHGACLGGGLELALACHGRVAASDPATRLGLPEVKFGIVPGFGGTRRLPRLIGFARGLEAILSSRSFAGRQALKTGLADDMCYPEQLPEVAEALARKLVSDEGRREIAARRRRALPVGTRAMSLPGLRHFAAWRARVEVRRRTRGRYPAPLRAIALVSGQWGGPREAWLAAEARTLADLIATPAACNLIRLFFQAREAGRQPAGAAPRQVSSVALVGTGLMGGGIAAALADRAEVAVNVKGTSWVKAGGVLRRVWDLERKNVKRHRVDRIQAAKRFQLVSVGVDYGGFRRADLVIEAVQERLELKRGVYAEIEKVATPECVIATNTSSLAIDELALGLDRPERFLGLHFFMPAEVMPLVEVIPGTRTSPEALSTAISLVRAMDKVPVVVRDSPGFLVNRILAAYALEAAQLVEEGIPPRRVDALAVAFGFPMGPIRLVGEVGVEVMREVLKHIQGAFGGHLPAPAWVLREDLADGFRKGSDGKVEVDEAVMAGWIGRRHPFYPDVEITDRLFAALLNESVRCLNEHIAASAGDIDLAMVYGTGFPPEKGGPLREADARGLPAVVKRNRELADKFGARFLPPRRLLDMAGGDARFHSA